MESATGMRARKSTTDAIPAAFETRKIPTLNNIRRAEKTNHKVFDGANDPPINSGFVQHRNNNRIAEYVDNAGTKQDDAA